MVEGIKTENQITNIQVSLVSRRIEWRVDAPPDGLSAVAVQKCFKWIRFASKILLRIWRDK